MSQTAKGFALGPPSSPTILGVPHVHAVHDLHALRGLGRCPVLNAHVVIDDLPASITGTCPRCLTHARSRGVVWRGCPAVLGPSAADDCAQVGGGGSPRRPGGGGGGAWPFMTGPGRPVAELVLTDQERDQLLRWGAACEDQPVAALAVWRAKIVLAFRGRGDEQHAAVDLRVGKKIRRRRANAAAGSPRSGAVGVRMNRAGPAAGRPAGQVEEVSPPRWRSCHTRTPAHWSPVPRWPSAAG